MRQTTLLAIGLIAILGFVAYANSLNGEFVWDDEGLIKNNVYIKDPSNIAKIFTKNIEAGAGGKSSFYRPVPMITYMISYSLWGLNVKGYHLTNVFLHILAALSIFWLINILFKDKLLSLFTGALFVIHPIHTETVAYISGRADCLALLFMLLSFIFYIKHLHLTNKGFYILAVLTYIFALLSRENSLIFPALLLLYHYTFKKRLKLSQFLPILTITFAYILLRLTLLKSLLSYTSGATSFLQRMPSFFAAITNYIRLIFLPFHLHMEYGKKMFLFSEPRVILGILILSSLLIYAARKRDTDKLTFFSISWFFLGLLPFSNIYPLIAYMAEHWLYLPSIGFFLILAKFLTYIYRAKNFRIAALSLIIFLPVFYSYLTIKQNNYWDNPIAFYERTIKYAPDNQRMHNNLGARYYHIGKKDKAIALYKKAIELEPDYAEAHNNLGNGCYNLGKEEEAIALYKKAIRLDPDYARAYNNLSIVYLRQRQYALAIEYCDRALKLGFNNPALLEALKPYRDKHLFP